MNMCKKTGVFFCSNDTKTNTKKPQGFNHFMLKEVLDESEELSKNLSFYLKNKDKTYKLTNMFTNGCRAQIFASNEWYSVAVFFKKVVYDKFLMDLKIIKIGEEKQEKVLEDKDVVSIFFPSKKDYNFVFSLKTKKVVFSDFLEEDVKNNIDVFLPVFFDKEKINVKTKSIISFCFVVLLALSNGKFDIPKQVIDKINDFDIMPIVNFAKSISYKEKVCFIDNKMFCFDVVCSLFYKTTKLQIERQNSLGNKILIKNCFLLLKDKKDCEDLFCLDNMGISYFAMGYCVEDRETKNSLIVAVDKNFAEWADIVFIFYMQLIAFYISLFQDINPDKV